MDIPNFKNATDLLNHSREARELFMSMGEHSMGKVILNSDSIKTIEDLKKYKKRV